MSRTELRLEGGPELERALREMGPEMEREIAMALDKTGLTLRGDIIKRYQRGPATGEPRSGKGRAGASRASAPGEAPMTDSGDLVRGTVYNRVPGELAVEVENTTKTKDGRHFYGFILEFGSRDGRIKERPAWRPAIEKIRPRFVGWIEDAIKKAIR